MGKKLIQDFIIPALNSQKYGELLKWVNYAEGIFQIKWSHKNAARWSHDDTAVFQAWDRLKGHYKPENKSYYMQAKQRFRAALQKLKESVIRLDTADKGFKNYRLLDLESKRKLKAEKEKKKLAKKTVKAIPTSVICQNLSYNRNAASSPSISSSASCSSSSLSISQESCVSSLSNESSELEMLEQSYKSAQEKQMRSIERISSDEETMSSGEASDSDQKENVENQTQQRVLPPHIPIQPSPTYNMIPIYENFSTPRYESPQILLVKTHYEAKPRPMRNYNIGCVMVEPPSALNLSVKHN